MADVFNITRILDSIKSKPANFVKLFKKSMIWKTAGKHVTTICYSKNEVNDAKTMFKGRGGGVSWLIDNAQLRIDN